MNHTEPAIRCNSAYCLRYWNFIRHWKYHLSSSSNRCNSAYRLRYWNPTPFNTKFCLFVVRCNSIYYFLNEPKGARQQRSKTTMRPAHPKYLNEVKVKRRCSSNSTYRLWYWNWPSSRATPSGTTRSLQQYLPFTVLKLFDCDIICVIQFRAVATAPTVYGIETLLTYHKYLWFVFGIAIAFTVYNFRVFLHFRTSKYLLFKDGVKLNTPIMGTETQD